LDYSASFKRYDERRRTTIKVGRCYSRRYVNINQMKNKVRNETQLRTFGLTGSNV
jgi:hypothetical protein